MKRLVDSSASEFSRSLLRAGIEERPPPQGRLKLLLSLGLVGGITLASSKAIAWLATSTGKLTVVAAGVAMTGGATYYVTAASTTENSSQTGVPQAQDVPRDVPANAPLLGPTLPEYSEPERPAVAEGLEREPAVEEGAQRPRRTRPAAKRSAERKRRRRRSDSGGPPEVVSPAPEGKPAPGLEQEVNLVDEIRVAVEAGTGAHKPLVERYRRLYPKGQLAVEVERLSASGP